LDITDCSSTEKSKHSSTKSNDLNKTCLSLVKQNPISRYKSRRTYNSKKPLIGCDSSWTKPRLPLKVIPEVSQGHRALLHYLETSVPRSAGVLSRLKRRKRKKIRMSRLS